jgi:2-polyprenyl-3-methyl-5-hydroxy-6-metoxy-1,4-benzoquinol methylase
VPEGAVAERRFAFGENWLDLLPRIDDARVRRAEEGLRAALRKDDLSGLSFLDAGSGSGLFSLAAARLGASRVHSFDLDPKSVECTMRLRSIRGPELDGWTIERGDLLDRRYCASLGQFDVVYCFGVAHHTGAMWQAVDHLVGAVAPGGLLSLAVYNDQGAASERWRRVKRFYHRLPQTIRPAYAALVWLPFEAKNALDGVRDDPRAYLRTWTDRERGMGRWHDIVDWVGGYPFEVAMPEQVFERARSQGLELVGLKTARGGLANNEFLFRRPADGL